MTGSLDKRRDRLQKCRKETLVEILVNTPLPWVTEDLLNKLDLSYKIEKRAGKPHANI